MNLRISTRGVDLTDDNRRYTERRLRFALGRFLGRMRRVTLRLKDLNGPKGGVDTRCTLQIDLRGMAPIVIEATRGDVRAAVDRAADRAEQAVSRRIDRALTLTRRPSRAA